MEELEVTVTESNVQLVEDEKTFADFLPFMRNSKRYFMNEQLQKIREDGALVGIVSLAFNYAMNTLDLEQNLCKVEERITLLFNFIGMTFQLFTNL